MNGLPKSLQLVAALLLLTAASLPAVIVAGGDGTQNTTAPASDQGWSYVGSVNYSDGSLNASGIYLGQYGGSYWVLTANHVATSGLGSYTLNGTTYGFVTGSGQRVGTLDLYVVQISITDPGDPLLSVSNLALAATSPVLNTPLTMVGYGRNRAAELTPYYVDTSTNPYTWSTTFPPGTANAAGYQYAAGNTKRWGSNTSEGTSTQSGTTYLVTDFDNTSGQGQAAVGDSGGGVFAYNSATGQYELAGVMVTVGTYSGQPAETAIYGDTTYSIDIATYRSLILSTVPEPSSLALLATASLLLLLRKRRPAPQDR